MSKSSVTNILQEGPATTLCGVTVLGRALMHTVSRALSEGALSPHSGRSNPGCEAAKRISAAER